MFIRQTDSFPFIPLYLDSLSEKVYLNGRPTCYLVGGCTVVGYLWVFQNTGIFEMGSEVQKNVSGLFLLYICGLDLYTDFSPFKDMRCRHLCVGNQSNIQSEGDRKSID